MTIPPKLRQLLVGLPAGLALTTFLTATPAVAAAAVNKGDNTWMLPVSYTHLPPPTTPSV